VSRALWVGILAAGTSLAAVAQDSRFYVGASIGQSRADFNNAAEEADLADLHVTHTGVTSDDKDAAWKIFVGYRFGRYFGLEAAFLKLGEWSQHTTFIAVNNIPVPPAQLTITMKAKEAYSIAAVGILPLSNDFSLFGKLGRYQSTIAFRGQLEGSTFVSQGETHDNDWMFGAGATYELSKRTALRVEWERFDHVGDNVTGEGPLNLLSMGLAWRF
jgi:OOP family OmpA-OmpF porin